MSPGKGAPPPDEVRARAVITGRVQGVCFRAETRSRAERLGVKGWVRNLPDGSVEVLAEGPRGAVEGLLSWCRQGPALASVEEVRVAWEPPGGLGGRFAITR